MLAASMPNSETGANYNFFSSFAGICSLDGVSFARFIHLRIDSPTMQLLSPHTAYIFPHFLHVYAVLRAGHVLFNQLVTFLTS